jgi:hypothetical protein
VKKNAGGPGTPETDAIWAKNKDIRDPAKIEGDLIEHAEKLERERDAAIAALQDATHRAERRATTENNVERREPTCPDCIKSNV